MKTISLENPSKLLIAAVKVVEKEYIRTCLASNCNHSSHEPGYDWFQVEVEDDFEPQIHIYPGTPSSHSWCCLKEEHLQRFAAKGIPPNAPQWAYSLDTLSYKCGYAYGQGVDVAIDGNFTVVKLMVSSNSRHRDYREDKIFATREGKTDDTKEYRKMKYNTRKERLADFQISGLNLSEAERLFKIGNEQWTREQESLLIANAPLLRDLRGYLRDLARAESRMRQSALAVQAGLINVISGMSCPRTQSFALKALWVFYGEKDANGKREELPDLKTRPELTSLGDLFPVWSQISPKGSN